ncbi:hypothetical protein CHS0354_040292 [Potamilus streckersoni]|uniref:Rap-GAP domain-containing protein n=1 Tax=Potamilus streckersoni TaxID=2493646 RepID=A0AAE0S3T3_9BIVA|nr:hypothetical protein CHS0354_040292 [Potamilus streckersoni]
MSEELKPPFTGPISAETARLSAQQAVEYYQKQLQSRESSFSRSNAYEKSDRSGHSYINGRHSAATVQAELPDRFIRGGHRATIHSTQGPKGWKPKRGDNPGIDNSQVEKSTVRTQVRHGRGLYRSNSNLEMDSFEYTEEEEQANVSSVSSKREYGSTSSLDIMSTSGESFFAMLNDLKTEDFDQRSPAPAKLQEVLRGRAEPEKPTTVPFANAEIFERIANGSLLGASNMADIESDDNTQSPKSKTKLKHKDRKLRSKSITGETGPGVVRNIRRKIENDSGIRTSDNLSDTEIRGDDRFRRKAFVHYDCQSIGFNIESVMKNQNSSTPMLNMATGASAASLNRNSYAGEADDPDIIANTDDGDGRNNELVQSCPFFRNEIGGEKERTVGLTRSTAHSPTSSEASSHYRSAITVSRSPMCCGVSILDSSPTPTGHILPPHVSYKNYVIEYVDHGAYYYRHFFNGNDHQNYFGIDDNLGPVAVSVKREKLDERENNLGKSESGLYQYRIIIRTSELVTLRGCVLEDAIPSSSRLSSSRGVPVKEALEYVAPELQVSCLKQGLSNQKTYDQLLKVDEQGIWSTYKVGIMYCKAGQSTEEEMYNNEIAGPAFEEFLNLIGQKVELKGFEKYRAQLDNKSE